MIEYQDGNDQKTIKILSKKKQKKTSHTNNSMN